VNKVLKMDFKRQTAVLPAIFVLVGMFFLVPAITEKALATVHAIATGECGYIGQIRPCQFTLVSKHLEFGTWTSQPSPSRTVVTWSTTGGKPFGDEKGSVTYKVGEGTAVLSFENPVIGFNKCSVSMELHGVIGSGGSCTVGKGQNAEFTYNLKTHTFNIGHTFEHTSR
jgi:hypothetical protein